MRVLISGGAGFVGSYMAKSFKKDGHEVVVFDNLKRRGSELNLPIFKRQGIEFIHGDIRNESDFSQLKVDFDLFIEASAEPSVHAGLHDDVRYVIQTNLNGTLNCLEFARKNSIKMIFLSTSRVYSINSLKQISLKEGLSRFELNDQDLLGLTPKGITQDFSTKGHRSLYGSSKLSSELFIQEYSELFGLKAIINRCGVIAGPGQWGKVDQGVFTLWVAAHYFGKKLSYTGFGGEGKQVRDLLHPQDLYELFKKQLEDDSSFHGQIFNVGGGMEVSVSLKEMTQICEEVTGKSIEIEKKLGTASVDIPFYVTDNFKVSSTFNWTPQKSVKNIVQDIFIWLKENEEQVAPLFQ